ncbi:MAG TPA: polysaccharide biosynthesis C-terminal domain-containing protein [Candidatus Caccousia stercoris]|uniref:Polysaccharide biosynthesis C-terminal domain-containing protein n=1 Tax=Candidatus Caccousia stercoris TaxID=2840723 RepID=A0A9D1FTQ2_9FIRM|nr:polysaccharide biosynthesis C-terminal domain-containing protein [Candidatus Caccousia stercoris]
MKEKGKKTGVLQDALSTFGTNAFGAVLALVSSFCIMPVLDPGESGLITQNQIVGSALFTLLSFSVNSSIIYYVSRCKLKNVVRSIKRVTVVLTMLIAVAGVLVVLVLRDSYFADTALLYCVCAVAYGVFSFVSNVFLAILRGENKFRTYNLINLMQRVLTTLFSLTVFLWPTAAVIVSGSIFILLLSIIMAWRSIRRDVSYAQSPPAPENDREIGSGELLRYSLKSHVSNVLTFTNTNVSSIILKANNGLTDFGVFTKAYTIVQQIWILPDAVSMVIMSRIAAMTDTKDKTKLATLSCKLVTYITLICLPLVVLLAKIFIPILFPKYVDCIQPLTILTVGSFFITYAKVLANSIAAYGKPELNIISTAVGVVFNLGLSLVLIPHFLVAGAAIATSLSLTAQGITSIIIFCVYTKTPFYRLVLPTRDELSLAAGLLKRGKRT